MSRTEQRRTALRVCLLAIGWLGCLLAWGSVLGFDPADPPATGIWRVDNSLQNPCGPVGAWLVYHVRWYVGVGVYPLLILVTIGLLAASKGVELRDLWLRAVGVALVTAASAAAGTLIFHAGPHELVVGPGGVVGHAAAGFLLDKLQDLGTALLLTAALVVGLVLAADNLLINVWSGLGWAATRSLPALLRGREIVASGIGRITAREAPPKENPDTPRRSRQHPARATDDEPDDASEDEEEYEEEWEEIEEPEPEAEDEEEESGTESTDEPPQRAAPVIKTRAPRPAPKPKAPVIPPAGVVAHDDDEYELPPLALLEYATALDKAAIEHSCRDKAYVLEQTLNEFRLEVEVVAIDTGPVITVFELKLAPGIKVSQIASLTSDMARALKAPAVRVVAPLPGKNTIGIEVPNVDKEKVRLRDVMENAARTEQLAIPLYLGKDASGQPLVADMTRMPHLLIAGTTGSGKSVCVTSIIMSILMTRRPSEVNLILVDPKVVELAAYKDIPHLMCPIVTDVSKAEGILEWASTKMDERYALLAEAGVRDIRNYNRLGEEGLRERLNIDDDDEMTKIPTHLPYIVIVIDELADLMMMSAKEVEFFLCRIAQKSRAVGIHLIVSTQRPQANVVTGLIKSNLPSRIAFRVSSRLDSRIVLDQNGGEVLMGQGDMLFLPPGSAKLLRAQGTFVDDEELRGVVKHCREQRQPQFHPELVRMPSGGGEGVAERDDLFDEAADIIVASQRGSVSLLQRKLNVGYSRASRLIDQMYEAGVVGEYKGSQAREVLYTPDDWEAMKAQRDAEEAEEEEEEEEEHAQESLFDE